MRASSCDRRVGSSMASNIDFIVASYGSHHDAISSSSNSGSTNSSPRSGVRGGAHNSSVSVDIDGHHRAAMPPTWARSRAVATPLSRIGCARKGLSRSELTLARCIACEGRARRSSSASRNRLRAPIRWPCSSLWRCRHSRRISMSWLAAVSRSGPSIRDRRSATASSSTASASSRSRTWASAEFNNSGASPTQSWVSGSMRVSATMRRTRS